MEFFEIAGEMRREYEKGSTGRFPVRVCFWSSVQIFFSQFGRGGAVNGTCFISIPNDLEAHANVSDPTVEKLFYRYGEIKMIAVLPVNADVSIMGVVSPALFRGCGSLSCSSRGFLDFEFPITVSA